jgi:uncharacterized protein YjbK
MPSSADIGREIEIKLDLGSFTGYLKLVGSLGQIDSEHRLINGFFDSEDNKLEAAGWALRARAELGRGLITIKSRVADSSLAVVRRESEVEIRRAEALDILNLETNILDLQVEPIAFVNEILSGADLHCLVRFETCRQKKKFKIGDYQYILEIDKTQFPDGSVDYELEIELPDLEQLPVIEDQMRRMFHTLEIPFRPMAQSKLERALART